MKDKLKTLYLKDPVLAQEVAKVLGYTINAKDASETKERKSAMKLFNSYLTKVNLYMDHINKKVTTLNKLVKKANVEEISSAVSSLSIIIRYLSQADTSI